MKKVIALVLVAVMLTGLLPTYASAEDTGFEGKTLSVLGDSISTYTGVSNDETANATLKGGAIYYSTGRLGVYQSDTWWQQTIDAMKLKLLVNNSWSGSCVLNERSGTVGAYLDRCVQLHNASGEDPDLIAVYLGTNDFWSFPDALGTSDAIDYGALILAAEEGFTYATPKTTCEAYAIMLHKMKQRYPNAEIYCFTLLPRSNQSASKVQQLQEFNAAVKQVANRFGAYTVDLYNNCGIKADENFQFYVADNALHPGPAGMDAITGCFASSLLKNSRYVAGTVYDVSYELTDVIVDQGTASAVLTGSAFTCSLTAPVNHIPDVTVTMGDQDITAECYADGKIQISQVSGNIHIIARSEFVPKDPQNYRWECKDDQLVSVSESGNTLNQLTMTQGSITDGKFSNVKCTIEEAIVLKHDLPWIIEWTSEGTWTDTTDGALLLAGAASSSTADTPYLYRRHNSDFIAFGYASGGRYYNYGVSLSTHGIDGTAKHTYRLTNRISEDGSNMVYLSVDGQELAAMNHHWIGGTDQKKTVDWLNGKDLTFTYMGTSPHTIGNCYIDYIQVSENGHIHNYENGMCTGCGKTDPEYRHSYRWECENDQLISVNEFGNTLNDLTMTQGSITDGKFSNVKCTIEEAVVLKHDLPWIVEWTSEGSWTDTTDGALLFAGAASSTTADTPYLYRRHNSDFIAFGYASGGRYYNYGVSLSTHGIDGTAKHTYRLTNHISEDGSNMVYLSVDGQELAAMNHHWIGGTDQKKTVDWLNGKDLTFTYMGTSPHTIGNCYIDYVQVWENGHMHSYENGICTGCGDLDSEYLRNYRWECKDDQLVSISEFGNTHNRLTMTQGSITDGKFSNVKCTIEEAIVLKHDLPWIIEWTSEGSWTDTTDGALLFAGDASSTTADTPYLYRRHNSDFIAFGYASGGRYYNYGVSLNAYGIDGTAKHTYRLTNHISEDGSNMVYLSVDGQELAAMNHHWIGGTDQKKTVDWLNGKDLTFTNMGTSPHTIGNCYIDYIQVWENGHDHSYSVSVTTPTCTEQGYTTYTCSCGDSYVSDYVAATGNHTYENGNCTGCGKGSPTLTLQSPTLEFKDMICIVAFYTAENMEDAVEMGMITYKNQVTEWGVETADYVIPGASFDAATGRCYSVSQGIHAKYLADTVYLACYAKLKDGSYIYTKLAPYSPITYATNQLKNSADGKLKQLVAAMLNYGAAAQQYFGYHTDDLANAGMTEEQRLLPGDYRPDMVSTVAAVSAAKQGSFGNNSGFSKRYPAVSFEGAFCINYFFTPLYAPADGITMYYWTETDFAATEVLTAENATGFVTLACNETGEYRGDITGIAAKSLSEAVYVAAAYQDSDGTVWTSGVLGYSIGAYCASQATKGGDIATLAMATAVYGYHAKQYFG